ncbi:serine O-acetyltransferase [Akkermansia glycaniphila]|uniref:Serine acetyltransferase n=1 Tax=Akkermansia glycaniphila TaxID=1679444 RepID=A0A1C7PBT6_9BACT|nr:serine O-acetyltransferase [Akkermansia glycaniphila]OCA02928.1 serine acetyltransferase [Akkermansia glycaniphila]SEH84284.1 cyse: serine o-acetyltransferase [Akkermansia glycaniphila]
MTCNPDKNIPPTPEQTRNLWNHIRREARTARETEPSLAGILDDIVLSSSSLGQASAALLARKLARADIARDRLEPLILGIYRDHPAIECSMAADLLAIVERDAACHTPLAPLLYFKGYHAISAYRVSHALWQEGRHLMAYLFQSLASETFAIDIHPAARIGCGILLDHGTGFVVGETAIVENNVSILHEVTLGGTGKEDGDRHPIVRSGVLIGAGAKILGRVEIGQCAKIAASSVVLTDVPPHTTVAGVPAVIVGTTCEPNPALDMNQNL